MIRIVLLFLLLLLLASFRPVRLESFIQPFSRIGPFPRIVFRTTDRLVGPKAWRDVQIDWHRQNPLYTFVWYNNNDCHRFMSKHFPGPVLQAYEKLRPGAFKADLWRLCVLYKFGGVYIDAYAQSHLPLDRMIKLAGSATFISARDAPESGSGIHNGFIITTPQHPIVQRAIADIVQNVRNEFYGHSPLDITGPLQLQRSVDAVGRKDVYLGQLIWCPEQDVYFGTVKVISKYYSLLHYIYRKLRRKTMYSVMWRNRQVYNSTLNDSQTSDPDPTTAV